MEDKILKKPQIKQEISKEKPHKELKHEEKASKKKNLTNKRHKTHWKVHKKRQILRKKQKNSKIASILIKTFLFIVILYGIFMTNQTFSNQIPLLAVMENDNGAIFSGSIVNLSLKVKSGTGKIYVNLDTLEEIDTQISIINSQKTACNLFSLDCENYDFYYDFKGSTLVLKGPSASSAIAILTAKTIKGEKIPQNAVITGSLNSGGIVGNVGGVSQKVKTAQQMGFEKVLIPTYSEYNHSNQTTIKVIKVLNIIEAYNAFNGGDNFTLKTSPLDKNEYNKVMESLSNELCQRTNDIKSQTNLNNIKENSTLDIYKTQAEKSFNSSKFAKENKNFYSQGSFCYNSNINFKTIEILQKNLSEKEINSILLELNSQILLSSEKLKSQDFKDGILTNNDFYVYLILNDRIREAKKFIDEALKVGEKPPLPLIGNSNLTNITIINNISNISNLTANQTINNQVLINEKTEKEKVERIVFYALAKERLFTVNIWEKLITHSGSKVSFSDVEISNSCNKINNEILIKGELLKKYNIAIFDKQILDQQGYGNNYICIYKGLELIGKVNTVLNSVGLNDTEMKEYGTKILEFTKDRLSLNAGNKFPLIPFIYFEYSGDLLKNKNYASSLLYSNYALSYSDLNLYLDQKHQIKNLTPKDILTPIFDNTILLGVVLLIFAFV